MDDAELASLLADLESDRVERKASLSDKDRIAQAICAFANDLPRHEQPGVVFVGANDDGTCAGLPISDELLRTLSDLRSNGNILPFPTMQVERRRVAGNEVAVVIVEPSLAPPVRYRGRTWIRVGPRRDTASPEDEQRLAERRRGRDLPFDLRELPSATVDDLDLTLFQQVHLPAAVAADVLAANDRPNLSQLHAMRFASVAQDRLVPTVLGMLASGRVPHDWVPGAYVQYLRLDGVSLTDPIQDQARLTGPLPELMGRLDDKLQAGIHVATDITGGPVEVRSPDYPLEALRQLVRNAVLHRTYEWSNAPVRLYWFSDRVEIHSPGGPYGAVTCERFGQPGLVDYRNPNLAEVMRNLGYVQRFGVGLMIARDALAANGNPPAEFTATEQFALVVVRRRP